MLIDANTDPRKKRKLVVCVPLWGRKYIEEWFLWSWASLCSQRNLSAVANEFEVSVQIITRPTDCKEIREGVEYFQVAKQVRIELLPLLSDDLPDKYTAMTFAILSSMNSAAKERALFVFSGADIVWSDGSLGYLARQLKTKCAVFTWAGILDRRSATVELARFRNEGALQIESRSLARITLNNGHPLQDSWSVDENLIPTSPWCAIWRSSDNECAVIRTHAPTPVGLNFCKLSESRLNMYLDLLRRFVLDSAETFAPLFGNSNDVLIVSDSDDLLCVSLDSTDRKPPPPRRASCRTDASERTFLVYLARYQRFQHYISKFLFTRTYVLHTGELDAWPEEKILMTQNQVILQQARESKTSLLARLWLLLPSLKCRKRVSQIVFPVTAIVRKTYAMTTAVRSRKTVK